MFSGYYSLGISMRPADFSVTVYESIAVEITSTYTDGSLLANREPEKGPDTYWKELPSCSERVAKEFVGRLT